MLTVSKEGDTTTLIIEFKSESSWKNNVLVIALLGVQMIIISTLFIFLGTWMILPFAGIEVLILAIVLYMVSKKAHTQETISISPASVILHRGQNKIDKTWEFQRFYCQVETKEKPFPAHQSFRLFLGTSEEKVEIAEWLSTHEKQQLLILLRQALRR